MFLRSLFLVVLLQFSSVKAQTLVFAQLTGSPTMNTTGWNLAGAAYTGDTGGDANADNDELILTDNTNASSGAIFFNQPLDLATCYEWNVQFDFRMADGSNADGIAFCFLDVPPTGYVSGGGVGIPSTANGVKVIFDSYDNGCGMNPEIQIMNGLGYSECDPNVIRITNTSGGNLDFITDANYKTAVINYSFGSLTVTVNGQQYLTGNYNLNFIGYLGFTASTGGSTDRHSIRNVIVSADVATSDAGIDVSTCTGDAVQIGALNNPNYLYDWGSTGGLSSPTISNPSVTLTNNGTTAITETYTVTTTLASNPNSCPTQDSVVVTILPNTSSTINATVCNGSSYTVGGQSFSTAGIHQAVVSGINGCDSTITLNLSLTPTIQTNLSNTICQGSTLTFGNQTLTSAGNYVQNLLTSTGCDSIVNLTLSVNPILSSTQNQSICDGETFAFGNQTLSSAGNYTQTLQTSAGCDSIVNLTLSVNPILSSSEIQTICDGETYTFYGQVLTTAGSYNQTIQSTTGCDSIVTLDLVVNPIPSPPNIVSNSPLECPGDALIMVAEPIVGATYTWNGPGNFSSNDNELSLIIDNQNTGIYTVYIYLNGCQSPNAIEVISIANTGVSDNFDVPNVITPNNDGLNEEIEFNTLFSSCIPFHFQLVNRWGNLVFEQENGGDAFKGTTNDGSKLDAGIYFYKLVFDQYEKSGFIHIIR